MDSTRRVLTQISTVAAAVLGTMVAIPMALLFAIAYYVRVIAFGLAAFVGVKRAAGEAEKTRELSSKENRPPGRLAS
jgi:hypothetical protein